MFGHQVQAQGVSPYSAYGLGDLQSSALTPQLSMGQLSMPFSDPTELNVGNPATYSYLEYAVFSVDVSSSFVRINANEGSAEFNDTRLRAIAMGFPLKRGKWGMSMGLLPVSNVGYDLNDSGTLDTLDVNYNYAGEGGMNQFYLGVGGKVFQKGHSILSVGANGAFVFGTVDKIRKAIYPDDMGYYNTRSRSSLRIRDLSFDLSTYFETQLAADSLGANTVDFLAGAAYRFGTDLYAERGLLTESFVFGNGGTEVPRDTIQFIDEEKGQVHIPHLWSVGVGLRFNDQLTVGAEVHFRNWSKYSTTFDLEETSRADLQNTSRYSLGAVYYPAKNFDEARQAKYHKAMKYRLGFRYMDTYLQLNDEQLNQYGISFGLGLPLFKARSNSWFNIGCELGQRGTTDKNLLKEDYMSLYFGVSLAPSGREKWFKKSKID